MESNSTPCSIKKILRETKLFLSDAQLNNFVDVENLILCKIINLAS